MKDWTAGCSTAFVAAILLPRMPYLPVSGAEEMATAGYVAAKNAAAIVEESWLGVLRLSGPDRQSWLQAMVTNDVLQLKPGEGCYAGHLTAQGKLVAQMLVLAADDS